MPAVTASPYDLEDANAGELSLELIAVRYTGDQTLYDVQQHLSQAGWPGLAPLDGGPTPNDVGAWNIALVADRHLAKYEGRPDLGVVYADQREQFAEIILSLDPDPMRALENVFGPGSDAQLRDRVFDTLGIEHAAQGGPLADQLREVAGLDEEDIEDDDTDSTLISRLTHPEEGYSRAELGDICKELRGDADEFNLRENAGKTARAEFISEFEQEDRQAAIEAALGGEN